MVYQEYLKFWGFTINPFSLTVEDNLFFPSSKHLTLKEVIVFSIEKGEKGVVLYGEAGVGKSHTVKYVLKKIEKTDKEIFFVSCPPFLSEDFLSFLKEQIGLEPASPNPVSTFSRLLTNLSSQKKRLILIIDEAQNLGIKHLESLKHLFNLEESSLVQIFLVGNPSLKRTLKREELASFYQRITLELVLEPLSFEETKEYVLYRIAKAEGEVNFHKDVWELVYQYTRGIPREINKLMDRVLFIAYAEKEKFVNPKHVEAAIETFSSETEEKKEKGKGLFSRLFFRGKLKDYELDTLKEEVINLKRAVERINMRLDLIEAKILALKEEKVK